MLRKGEIPQIPCTDFVVFIYLHTFRERGRPPNFGFIQRQVFSGKSAIWIMIFCYNGHHLDENPDFYGFCKGNMSLQQKIMIRIADFPDNIFLQLNTKSGGHLRSVKVCKKKICIHDFGNLTFPRQFSNKSLLRSNF